MNQKSSIGLAAIAAAAMAGTGIYLSPQTAETPTADTAVEAQSAQDASESAGVAESQPQGVKVDKNAPNPFDSWGTVNKAGA